MLRPLIPLIEEEILQVTRDGFNMTYDGKEIHVSVKSSLTMKDGKMHSALQGTLGGFCQMCRTSKVDCHKIEVVQNGLPIDRRIEDMHSIFQHLSTGDGNVVKKVGDYGTRAGVTAEPITHRELNSSLSNTHAWTCCASWFLDVLYHIVAKDKTWGFGSKTDPRYKKLMKAKSKVQDAFQEILGRRIDAADGTGHTGNSLTGNMARRFFGDDCREILDSLITDKVQMNIIKKLHKNINVILRIISSKNHQIDIDQFANLCTTTYIDILTYFPGQT